MTEEQIVGVLASRFSWPGADREDVRQEARFALERCRGRWQPGRASWPRFAWMCVEAHLIELQRRECYRRPQFAELDDVHASGGDVVSQVEARRRLRLALELPLPPRQREAVDRALVGAPCPRGDGRLDLHLWRGKRKLLTAAA